MDARIPEPIKALQDAARSFVREELIPLEREFQDVDEPGTEVRQALVKKVKERSLWALDVPQEHGGGGLSALGSLLLREEASRTHVPSPFTPSIFGLEYSPVLRLCRGQQEERFLRPLIEGQKRATFLFAEGKGGSDPNNIATKAVKNGASWTLDGAKAFTIGAQKADFALVFAITDEQKELSQRFTCFLVEKGTPGFKIARTVPMLPPHLAAELSLENCQVPDENILGEMGMGFELAQQAISHWEGQAGAICLGIASRCQEMALRFSQERMTFGQPIAHRQAIQFMLSDNSIDTQASRVLVFNYAVKMDAGEDAREACSMAKVFASEMVGRVVDRTIQIHGSLGLSRELPLERFYREARCLKIMAMTTEIHRMLLARELLGEELSL